MHDEGMAPCQLRQKCGVCHGLRAMRRRPWRRSDWRVTAKVTTTNVVIQRAVQSPRVPVHYPDMQITLDHTLLIPIPYPTNLSVQANYLENQCSMSS